MKSLIQIVFLLLILLFSGASFGQEKTKLSELKADLAQMKTPTSSTEAQAYIDLLIKIGLKYRFVDNDSLNHYTEMAQLTLDRQKNKNALSQALIFRNKGYYYSENGESQKALEYYNKTLDISKQQGFTNLKLKSYIWMSDEYYYLDQKGNELTSLLKVIDEGEKDRANCLLELSIATENIAFLYADQEEFEKALDYFKKVLSYNKELNKDESKAQSYTNLADTLSEMGDFTQAQHYIDLAIAIFEEKGNAVWLATAYQIKGLIFYESDQFEQSLKYILKAKELLGSIDDERLRISLLLDHAYVLYRLGQLEEAQKKVQQASQSKLTSKDVQLKQECLELLFEINKAKGESESALTYLEDYRSLSDSILRVQKANRIDMLFAQLKFEDEKQAIVQTNREIASRQKNQLTLALAVAAVLLVTLIPLYFKQKRLNVLNSNLQEREKELVEINQTKDIMFSILGHDLKSPLVSFHSALKLFNEGILENKSVNTAIDKMDKNLDHLLLTLDNLLFWGASQLKGSKTYPGSLVMRDVVEKAAKLLFPLAEAKNIRIENQVPEVAHCLGDRDQIELVIRNLLTNAIKYTPKEGENIQVKSVENENHWSFYVEDSGVGMNKKTQLDLQNRTLLRSSQGTGNEKGSGIGLLLTQRMVKSNGGSFGFSSEPDKGAVFYFTLPKYTPVVPNKIESEEDE